MTEKIWLDVCSRLSPVEPVDLDQKLFGQVSEYTVEPGIVRYPSVSETSMVPSAVIWAFEQRNTICIGVRLTQPIAHYSGAAARLAAVAVERSVTPIILTSLPYCGFERFGFRVERLAGETSEELTASEEELKRFWRMDVIIDLSDVMKLT